MNILVLMTEAFAIGGIQRMNRHVCLALSRFAEQENHQISFLSLMDGSGNVDKRYLEGDVAFCGYQGNRAAFIKSVMSKLQTRPDVVYATHVRLAPLIRVLKLIRPSLRMGVALYGIDAWRRLPFLQRSALQLADFVTSISEYTSEQTVKLHNVRSGKICLIPPALDPFWMIPGPDSVLDDDIHNSSKAKIILTVTRLASSEKLKGVDCVIRAMPKIIEEVSDIQYVIVGTGDDIIRLSDLAKRKGVQENVLFVGEITDEQLRDYYLNCDIFVLPSKKEGFGIVFLEAMFFKKPVIGGDFGGSRDVICDGSTGFLVNYGDINQLSHQIIELLTDKQKSTDMGKAGYSRLSDMYTFNHFENNLRKVFQKYIDA